MSRSKSGRKNPFKNLNARLNIEPLENRVTPTAACPGISGYVYYDANNNGLFDTGETPIANSTVELRDASNVVVGTTTTDAAGYYEFDTDMAHPTLDSTLTKTVTFDRTQTNFTLNGLLDQFDSSLGELQSIEIQHNGSITSEIKAENFSNDSESDITGTVSGTLTLTGPGGLNNQVSISGNAGSFHAAEYDGSTDFDGASGGSFGEQTANGANTTTITGNDMAAFIGTGQVTLTETGVATSNASGGGNLDVRVRSTALSSVTVIYHYKAYDCLAPGDYTIIQTQQPNGYTDGKESKDGTVIPNTIGTDTISVTLGNVDLVHNDFGELKVTQISGHVWHDANNDGIRDATEELIPGTTITLEGPGGPLSMLTDANGFYHFDNLQPGTYTVKETQPVGYLDGKDKEGTLGGTVVNNAAEDQIQSITLAAGDDSQNNDFGELKPASIAGHVYYDLNNNGVFEATESPIAGTTVTLTGFNDNGPVNLSMQTNAAGEFKFADLRPGTYALNETQPATYADGKDTIGTPGGTTGNDVFSSIVLNAGVDGVNNDFGEIRSSNPVPPDPIPKNVDPLGMLPAISKTQMTSVPLWTNIDPAFRGQMAFVVGATITATGQQLDLNGTMAGVAQLQAGTTPAAFVNNLWTSNAHRDAQVVNLYQDILNRAPSWQELATAKHQLNTGADALGVMETLYSSSEFQQLHAGPDALAVALSEGILNTTPGTADTQALLQSMANEPLSQVVHDLLHSDAALANFIDDAYLLTLRRHPNSAEIQTWTASIKAGTTTLDSLEQRLLAGQEFYLLAFNNIH